MIIDKKITAWEHPIVNEADRPTRSASDMKQVFDANANQIKAAFNELIDELLSSGAAAQIGSATISGLDGETVRAQLGALMGSKIASGDIKKLRMNENGYLEASTDGVTWANVPTWGEIEIEGGGEAKNLTVSFSTAEELANIQTGENMQTMFGKIKKWFASGAGGILNLSNAADVREALGAASSGAVTALETSVSAANTNITALQDKDRVLFTDGSTPPNYAATDARITSLEDGLIRIISFHAAGTSAMLSINGLGAKPVYTSYGNYFNPKATQRVKVMYSAGNGCFFVVSPGGGVEFPATPSAGDTAIGFCSSPSGTLNTTTPQNIPGMAFTVKKTGTYRISSKLSGANGYILYAQITKNGVLVPGSGFDTGSSYGILKKIDISCVAGDIIRLQGWANQSAIMTISYYWHYIMATILAGDVQTAINEIIA